MAILLSNESIKRLSKYGLVIITFMTGLVVLLILLAIKFFPDQYSFFTSYLSDLGMKNTRNGYDNATSSLLFSLAMFTSGLASAGFWYLSASVINTASNLTNKFKIPVLIGALSGFISSFFNALIGVFPYDTAHAQHEFVGKIFFALVGLAMLMYSFFFIYLFISDRTDKNILLYGAICFILPVIFAFIVLGYVDQIDNSHIFILAIAFIVLNILALLIEKVHSLIEYLSFIISFSMFVLETLIVFLLLNMGLKPVLEVSVILGTLVFITINNARVLELD